ncbi:HD domain-containing protein [Candidatus Marsarchaeota archaeon]|nr:HD domain-containing protein [Candidatus Marsarchaeota archaeon]
MNIKLRSKLINIAKRNIRNDLSHDFSHAYRVLVSAEKIGKKESADMDVLVPAALFHDVRVYKGTRRHRYEHKESSDFAKKVLETLGYHEDKINNVAYAISVCSFSKNIKAETLEAKILQDADLLEAEGAVAIMRTFASAVSMHLKSFYNMNDPFCRKRTPNEKIYAIDHFYSRLLVADTRLNTKTAKMMASRKKRFLLEFLKELGSELRST